MPGYNVLPTAFQLTAARRRLLFLSIIISAYALFQLTAARRRLRHQVGRPGLADDALFQLTAARRRLQARPLKVRWSGAFQLTAARRRLQCSAS